MKHYMTTCTALTTAFACVLILGVAGPRTVAEAVDNDSQDDEQDRNVSSTMPWFRSPFGKPGTSHPVRQGVKQ